MSAFCHITFISTWVTHVLGQCFTLARLSSLVRFHVVWLGSCLCLLFPVPTHCAAHLLFMNACKATSAVANGTGTLPCSGVNNAFWHELAVFQRYWWTFKMVEHNAVLKPCEYWPMSESAAIYSLWHIYCLKGRLMRCSKVVPSYFLPLHFLRYQTDSPAVPEAGRLII